MSGALGNSFTTPTKVPNIGIQSRQFNIEGLVASPRDNQNYQEQELIRKRSHDAHNSVAINNAMTNHDLEYFEEMI